MRAQKRSTFERYRLGIGSFIGVAGMICLFIALASVFTDLRFTIPGVVLVVTGGVIAGRNRLRQFIANILP